VASFHIHPDYQVSPTTNSRNGHFPSEDELADLPFVFFWKITFGVSATGLYVADALPLTKPTVSKH